MRNFIKANYRIWSISTAVFIALSVLPLGNMLTTVTYAAPIGASITGIAAEPLKFADSTIDAENLEFSTGQGLINFSLGFSNFDWDAAPNTGPNSLTREALAENNITAVVAKVRGGEDISCTPLFESYYPNGVRLSLRFSYDIPGWETQPFEFTVGLAQDGVEEPATRVTLKGSAYDKTKIIHVVNGDDYVWLQNDNCIIADEDIAAIELDFDGAEGVSLITSLQAGQTYYGKVDTVPTAADLQLMAQYPQITDVRRLMVTDNLKNSHVAFYDKGHTYQVYSALSLTHRGSIGVEVADSYLRIVNTYFSYEDAFYLSACKLDEPIPQKHSVTYDPNGATGGIVPVDTRLYYPGENISVLFPSDFYEEWEDEYLRRDGYYFFDWNTKPDGTGNRYDEFIRGYFFMGNKDITFYAQWVTELAFEIRAIEPKPLVSMDGLQLDNLTLSASDVVRLKLDESNFEWWNQPLPLSAELLRWNRIDVSTRFRKGTQAFVSSYIEEDENGNVYVAIRFKSDSGSPSPADIEFSCETYLLKNKVRANGTETVLNGTISLPAANNGDPSGGSDGDGGSGSGGGGGSSSGSGSGGGGGSSSGSGGSGGSGGGGGLTLGPTDPAPVTGPVTVNDATNLTQKALNAAKQAGNASATVKFKNVGELSLEAAQAMLKAAGNIPMKVHADSTLNNGTVDVRISFDPANVIKNVNLSASTVSNRAQSIKSYFAKWFSNKTQIISFAQQGDWGMPVEAALKLDKELDAKTLLFFSYDRASNTYKQIPHPNYWVDVNGYVHFTATVAGDIIITDKPIAKK